MFPGGIADKLGNEYERQWAVRNLLHVISGSAVAIRYEGITTPFRGFEFQVCRPDHSEWHQTKINAPHTNWTPNALDKEGVLNAMRQRLAADGAARCIFVSQDPSKTMRELCARARTANDVHEFLNAVSKKDRENFGLIQDKYWEVGAVTAFQWLSRCEFRTESTPSLEDRHRQSWQVSANR